MTTSEPFSVSVIIPVFNAEKFVARAVESVRTLPEVGEVVLVEDGSPDGSLAVCRQLESSRPDKVRLFRHPDGTNRGAGPSRNLGIRQARHPFIAFLDADDRYLPHRFARDAELLTADPALDGTYNALGLDFLDEEGRRWWEDAPRKRPPLTTLLDPPAPEDLFVAMSPVGTRGYFSFDAATFRRAAFDKAAYFSDLPLSQDTLLAMQMAAACRLAGATTREPVALRGVHAGNRIRDPQKMRQALRAVFRAFRAWPGAARLAPAQRAAFHLADLRIHRDWPAFARACAACPALLFRRQTYRYWPPARWAPRRLAARGRRPLPAGGTAAC